LLHCSTTQLDQILFSTTVGTRSILTRRTRKSSRLRRRSTSTARCCRTRWRPPRSKHFQLNLLLCSRYAPIASFDKLLVRTFMLQRKSLSHSEPLGPHVTSSPMVFLDEPHRRI